MNKEKIKEELNNEKGFNYEKYFEFFKDQVDYRNKAGKEDILTKLVDYFLGEISYMCYFFCRFLREDLKNGFKKD